MALAPRPSPSGSPGPLVARPVECGELRAGDGGVEPGADEGRILELYMNVAELGRSYASPRRPFYFHQPVA